MLFAENLLRLCDVWSLDADWVGRQRKGLKRFRERLECTPDASLTESGLYQATIDHLFLMPQLAQSASAIHLSSTLNIRLDRCLNASRICLERLPIDEMERPLRSPLWADDDAHMLRREWLHRLTLLQSRAIAHLLKSRSSDFEQVADRLWMQHPLWESLEGYRKQLDQSDNDHESRRLRLLLALSRLEAIVGNGSGTH